MKTINPVSITCSLMLVILVSLANFSSVAQSLDPFQVTIYIVRHGEVDRNSENGALNARGLERANDLAKTLERVNLTHAYSSHTLRSIQAVERAADVHDLAVIELPKIGSTYDDQEINSVSPARLAIEPLSEALNNLEGGSTALVGVNSDNVFAIMHNLGIPIGDSVQPCEIGSNCVPCLRNTCFPPEYDNLWIVRVIGQDRKAELTWLRYGRP